MKAQPNSHLRLTSEQFPDQLSEFLSEYQGLCDVNLVSDEQVAIRAHQAVLSSVSEVFRSLLLSNSDPSPVIHLQGTSEQDVRMLIEFMYKGKVNPSNLNTFLELAKHLKFKQEVLDNLTKASLEKKPQAKHGTLKKKKSQIKKLKKSTKKNLPVCKSESPDKTDVSNSIDPSGDRKNKELEIGKSDEVPEQDLIDSFCLIVPPTLENNTPQSDVYDDFSSELLQEESGPAMNIVPITENVQPGTIRILPKPTLFLEYDSQGRAVNIKKVDGRVQTSIEQEPASLLSVSMKDNHDTEALTNVDNEKMTNDPSPEIFTHSNMEALEILTNKSKKSIHKVQNKRKKEPSLTKEDLSKKELGKAKQHDNEKKQKSTIVEGKSYKKVAQSKNIKLVPVAPGSKNNLKETNQSSHDQPPLDQPKSRTEDKSAKCCECDLKVSHAVMLKAHIESRHYKLYREMYILRQITFDEWLKRKN